MSHGGPFLFLRKFLRHGTRVAAIRESSPALAAEVCRYITPEHPQVILELGAGNGAVTAAASNRLHPESRLIAVEIDPDFVELLRQRCPRAEALCADVSSLDHRLPELGVETVDLVLSGLPVPSLPKQVNAAVFGALAQFARGATFSQLTLMPYVYGPLYRALFGHVEFRFVAASLPPGGVYHCRELRDDWRQRVPGKS